jgi:CubicO group peptidase (beta-lactamase class C family)
VADYHRFCRLLLAGGVYEGRRLVSAETIADMTRNHLPPGRSVYDFGKGLFADETYRNTGFGLGVSVTLKPDEGGSVGDYGWGGVFSTLFRIEPRHQSYWIFMTQLLPITAYPLQRDMARLVSAARLSNFATT